MKKIHVNGLDIDYGEDLIKVIKKAYNKGENEEVTDEDIASFIKASLKNAVDKGYGVIE